MNFHTEELDECWKIMIIKQTLFEDETDKIDLVLNLT